MLSRVAARAETQISIARLANTLTTPVGPTLDDQEI